MRSVGEIAERLGFSADGEISLEIANAAHPSSAGPDELALAMDDKHFALLSQGSARAAMVAPGADWRAAGLEAAIFAPRARYGMAGVTALFAAPLDLEPGLHPSAVISPEAELGEDVWVGPLTVIGPRARIGRGARICGQVTIGAEASLGEDALIHPGVRLAPRVRLGDRAILHPNAVIGGDGFSFVTPEKGSVESAKETGAVQVGAENRIWARIHSIGSVVIGDDVEVGCGAAIDRGTVVDTRIGHGTKLDNLVQIGHNVQVGENCMLCGQVGVAGSAEIGDRVVIGGQSGVGDHLSIGDDTLVMAASSVGTNIRARSVVGGTPAVAREEFTRMYLATRRLPRLIDEVRDLKKSISKGERSG